MHLLKLQRLSIAIQPGDHYALPKLITKHAITTSIVNTLVLSKINNNKKF